MARIVSDKIERIKKDSNRVHDLVEAGYDFFYIDGKCYFQLDTYGTSNRLHRGKTSQSIQIDKESASVLISILKNVFDL